MATSSALSLRANLLKNVYSTPGDFETALADAAIKAAFVELMGDPSSCDILFASGEAFVNAILDSATAWLQLQQSGIALAKLAANTFATAELCKVGSKLVDIMDDPLKFAFWLSIEANYERLKAQVNATNSELHRDHYTSGSTWNLPTNLYGWCGVGVGGGGGSGGAQAGLPTGGGGGGQLRIVNILDRPTNLPVANVSVSIGAAGIGGNGTNGGTGGDTVLGSILSADGGFGSNFNSSSGATGGVVGSQVEGDVFITSDQITDTDFANAVWQCVSGKINGGTGGNATNVAFRVASRGSDGYVESRGGAGAWGNNVASQVYGGTSGRFGGGGGGGATNGNTYIVQPSTYNQNTGGGAPGSLAVSSGGNTIGRTADSGQATIYWIGS